MTSNIDMKMENQDMKAGLAAERREGGISAGDDAKKPGPEEMPLTNSPETEKNIKNGKKTGKNATGKSGKKNKKKSKVKKTKKDIVLTSDSSSSESDGDGDEQSASSSDSSSDSDEEEVEVAKSKRAQKKRQPVEKTNKGSPKKTKKHAKAKKAVSDSDTSDSESDAGERKSRPGNGRDLTSGATAGGADDLRQEMQQVLQLQKQAMVLMIGQQGSSSLHQTPPGAGGLGAGGLGGFGPGGLNPGLNAGFNPFNTNSFNTGVLDSLSRKPPPRRHNVRTVRPPLPGGHPLSIPGFDDDVAYDEVGSAKSLKAKGKRDGKGDNPRLEFKRVDQVWDNQIHNYKLQDTVEDNTNSPYDEYLFHVRRTFDWEGKYKTTIVDIKSKALRDALQEVIGSPKGVSLVEESPRMDPNLLFLYLEDIRKHRSDLKEREPTGKSRKERKKAQKFINDQRRHLKVLIKYLDKDYAQTKKSLYPLLENGLITFDLVWALWKPNTLAYTATYGTNDQPRVFKVECADKHFTIMKGELYYVEGKYLEFDGKQFGYGSITEEIGEFRGARKISSLGTYPLQYHKNEAKLREELIERGKKFVSLGGVNYKSHLGLAYYKKKRSVVRVNIDSRIMIDPSTHRRINPNYPISVVRPKDHDIISDDEDSENEDDGCCGGGSDEDGDEGDFELGEIKMVTKVIKDSKGQVHKLRLPKAPDNTEEKFDKVSSTVDDGDKMDGANSDETDVEDGKDDATPVFPDEEYLIASPVVLGFSLADKLWLEFTVSGVNEIAWNEKAYESLVLEPKTKDIVKALVESHKYHAAESIDDVIQGKGKGLVAVLHGPPGTGKTLTAEGISELLKCPLYMVSAGDLGTDSRYLESELQKILDICHAWGAILLLDEADVFLEKRNMADIHRNALVSIFLRQLEYFQGILFLTTNRVETFDDAFQSRIHIALRYDELDAKAKKAIFKIFIERVRQLEKIDLMPFSEDDYDTLARQKLNGRQIKNTVRTAQALAVNKGEPLSMRHVREVLDVYRRFERDLKGGTGYEDALNHYY